MVQGEKFHGLPMEDPLEHLDNFDRICSLIKINGVSEDSFKLRLFPFSLGDKAKQWEKTLPPGTINSWIDCKKAFLSKFFSSSRTTRFRNDISSFTQLNQESFNEAWERFKGYTMQCPHHGFTEESLLSTFYRGVTPRIRMLLDTASNGYFLGREVQDGLQLIENLALSDGNYNEDYDRAQRGGDQESTRKEIKQISDQLDKLLAAQQRQVNMVTDSQETFEVNQVDCTGMQDVSWVNGQPNYGNYKGNNNLSYRSTNVANPQDQVYPPQQLQQSYQKPFIPYNQGGYVPKNNFQGNQQNNFQGNKPAHPPGFAPQPAPPISLDQLQAMFQQVIQGQQNHDLLLSKKIAEVHTKMDCIATDMNSKLEAMNSRVTQLEKGKGIASTSHSLPGKPESNPKDFCHGIIEEEEAIIDAFLQSLDEDFSPNEDIVDQTGGIGLNSQGIVAHAEDLNEEDHFIIIKDAEGNDVKSLPKLTNPGKFSISCIMGPLVIEDAMCDTGSSVSVISMDMVKKIGVTCIDYHPFKITFGDGKARQPKGILLDYPLKINDCIIPTDFIVMDIPSSKNLPLLLGTPFLNSAGACMDYTSMRVTLSKVAGKPYFSISHPMSYYCGSMEDEKDVWEEEERIAKAEREKADLKRREEALAYLHQQEEEKFKKREPKKKKEKGPKKKSAGVSQETSNKGLEAPDVVSLITMFAEPEWMGTMGKSQAVQGKGSAVKKKKGSKKKKDTKSDLGNSTLSLDIHPLKSKEDSNEHKVEEEGSSNSFASAKAVMSKEMIDKGVQEVKEMVFTIYTAEVQGGSSFTHAQEASLTTPTQA